MNREAINAEVRALERLDLEGLRAVWVRRYGLPTPKLRSPELLALSLAWRIQAEAFGGLDAVTRRKLSDDRTSQRTSLDVPVGTVLTREWKGVAQSVRRTPKGFEWNGKTYRSLTAAARAISGGAWSGPRFFGLLGGAGGKA